MERLTEAQRANISKMSDDRLRSKLLQAGYREEVLAQLGRTELMSTFAELLAPESAQAMARVDRGEEIEGGADVDRSQLSLEERRLMLEQQRLEEQRLQREEQRLQLQLEQKKMELAREELDFKKKTAEREEAHRDSMAVKLKTWGDALRNAISKMPNEPIEMISWFANVKRLFEQLNVPVELQAVLVRPYFSERASNLLSRCDPTVSADYASIKKFLLQEFHLTPSVYLNKFRSMQYDKSETYSQFSAKLMAIFSYYAESRKIKDDFNRLMELIVYDKVKSVLPPFLSTHVIALESAHKEGWLGRRPLAEALDAYVANRPKPDNNKQQSPASGSAPNGQGGMQQGWKPKSDKAEKPEVPRKLRNCFICNSPNHLAASCPEKNARTPARPRPTPRVNTCVTSSNEDWTMPHGTSTSGGGNKPILDMGVDHSHIECSDDVNEKTDPVVTRVAVEEKTAMSRPHEEEDCVMEEAGCRDPLLADGWSQLRYVDVKIDGLPGVVHGLNDSGAQLCVVRAEVIQSLNLPKLGEAKLRGLACEVIPVDLVSLKIRMSQGNTYCNVTCAVCEDLNNDLILGSDIVDKLNTTLLREQCDMINVINVDDMCGNDDVTVNADDVCNVSADDEVAVVDNVDDRNEVDDDVGDQMGENEVTSDPNIISRSSESRTNGR